MFRARRAFCFARRLATLNPKSELREESKRDLSLLAIRYSPIAGRADSTRSCVRKRTTVSYRSIGRSLSTEDQNDRDEISSEISEGTKQRGK
jgi:hypothetical protein